MARKRKAIDNCPHSDRLHYAKGMCRQCYRIIFLKDSEDAAKAKYKQTDRGRESDAAYEATEKARLRKREWARKNRKRLAKK